GGAGAAGAVGRPRGGRRGGGRPPGGGAGEDGGLRPPRAAAPRRSAVAVRAGRRLALQPVGDQPERTHPRLARSDRLHRRRPPRPAPASKTASAPAKPPASAASPPTRSR